MTLIKQAQWRATNWLNKLGSSRNPQTNGPSASAFRIAMLDTDNLRAQLVCCLSGRHQEKCVANSQRTSHERLNRKSKTLEGFFV